MVFYTVFAFIKWLRRNHEPIDKGAGEKYKKNHKIIDPMKTINLHSYTLTLLHSYTLQYCEMPPEAG